MVLLQEGQFINCPYKLEHVSKENAKGTENKHAVIQNGFLKFHYLKYHSEANLLGEKKSLAS